MVLISKIRNGMVKYSLFFNNIANIPKIGNVAIIATLNKHTGATIKPLKNFFLKDMVLTNL